MEIYNNYRDFAMMRFTIWLFIFLLFLYIVASKGYSYLSHEIAFRLTLFVFAIFNALFVTYMTKNAKQRNVWQQFLLIIILVAFIVVMSAIYIYFLENYVWLSKKLCIGVK